MDVHVGSLLGRSFLLPDILALTALSTASVDPSVIVQYSDPITGIGG
jgi:hypothetical protein